MNDGEFNQLLQRFAVLFPDAAQWLGALPSQQATLAAWLEIFQRKRISLTLALDAIEGIARGDADCPRGYQRDEWPAFIVKAVRELRLRHEPAYQAESDQLPKRVRYTRPPTAIGLWAMSEMLASMRKAGATQAEQKKWLDVEDAKSFPQQYPK